MVHPSIDPVADRRHADGEALPRGRNTRTARKGHGPCKGTGHDAGDSRPAAGAEPNGMHLNGDIGGVNEESLQVLDVLGNSRLRSPSLRPPVLNSISRRSTCSTSTFLATRSGTGSGRVTPKESSAPGRRATRRRELA